MTGRTFGLARPNQPRVYNCENIANVLNNQTQVLDNGVLGPRHNSPDKVIVTLDKPFGVQNHHLEHLLNHGEFLHKSSGIPHGGEYVRDDGENNRIACPGIDFGKLSKPGHLVNSEVLKYLEEEETARCQKGFKRVAWPPPPEDVNEPAPLIEEPPPVYSQTPSYTHAKAAPPGFTEPPPKRSWENQIGSRPVHEPPAGLPRPIPITPTTPTSVLRTLPSPPKFDPPPTTITLRATPPIQQAPAPVFESQPAATLDQGGNRMRGDEKWPPAPVKEQAHAENLARKALAQGPAMRPRRVKKDYGAFFAQNALNSSYPGYRAPPGTQHYIEDGTSQL